MDSMTTGSNSEIWCKSKRQLNMTALANQASLITVSCTPEILLFQLTTITNSIIEPKPVLWPGKAFSAVSALVCG
jgi:hypothetical protein